MATVDLRCAARPRAQQECHPRRPRTARADRAAALADLGYEGEPDTFTPLFKKPKDGQITIDEQSHNALHSALPYLGEYANSSLKTTYKTLHRYRGHPCHLRDIVATLSYAR
ncbi:hypothetical protein E1202_07730 [Saccharopolyspora karakumensis]|uniref:DDE Tnp4 domain-containing protein n=1 Tax=Saccharopolyspora karakumensis TaxID=2530386 RepID=A0A4R5BYL7_9PSEU|nr:transposase family protein [Saccharopolyspora karakumensis]TDD90520.1 hypothetical protein E1202_07730 [Saccharopolyspora karakumensis]